MRRRALLPSGAAAISTALLSVLSAGDHLLITDSVYRPTRNFADTMLKRYGVETSYYDPLIGAGIAALFKPNTRAVFVEAPGSQTFEMQDIPAIAAVAHDKGAVVLMDNTWATPLYYPAFEHGVDLSIQAGTKYIGGHSDIMFGTVSANAATWPQLNETVDDLSDSASGRTTSISRCAACARMAVRLERHQTFGTRDRALVRAAAGGAARAASGAAVAIPATRSGSATSPAPPACSASCSSRCRTRPSYAFCDALTLFGMGFSWGGYESLVILFDCEALSHRDPMGAGRPGPALPYRAGGHVAT